MLLFGTMDTTPAGVRAAWHAPNQSWLPFRSSLDNSLFMRAVNRQMSGPAGGTRIRHARNAEARSPANTHPGHKSQRKRTALEEIRLTGALLPNVRSGPGATRRLIGDC